MMKGAYVNLFAFGLASATLWFLNLEYANPILSKGYKTALAATILYFLFKVVAERGVVLRVKDSKTRYNIRKSLSVVFYTLIMLAVATIWVENPQSLVVAYGLVAAGITISLQDFFKNLAGGLMILLNNLYRVGDRIEVAGNCGDVIDVGVFYTTILEIRGWVAGDQLSGRISTIPNGLVLSNTVNNYTRDHSFIWDEITVTLTYDSDWRKASESLLEVVREKTKDVVVQAERDISRFEEKYYLPTRSAEPAVYLSFTDNWIEFHIRYVTQVRGRRLVRAQLSKLILEEIDKSKNVKIASQTYDVTVNGRLRQE
jgi:small-conductance mechanosensitive channel